MLFNSELLEISKSGLWEILIKNNDVKNFTFRKSEIFFHLQNFKIKFWNLILSFFM